MSENSKRMPDYIGCAVLARRDPNKGWEKSNIEWRTALSEEEAEKGIEIYVGAALRARFLHLINQGHLPEDCMDRVMSIIDEEVES